ncbi:hypothetical protein CYLTODRAFT_424193 [Cylindrobasidium torrendii FP15055 ss-10]|uniref:Uncharacterized protein n=1 Tax=Cylindrobasidium torrendii FP15055 ss-10 TaxID=1314674 RepID=A0A0D7B7V9_9AGAR|nr:hypothetical protein CYLTODRAFT_424193 [Cylindrobasidium torrendii FP15055 ss-10]
MISEHIPLNPTQLLFFQNGFSKGSPRVCQVSIRTKGEPTGAEREAYMRLETTVKAAIEAILSLHAETRLPPESIIDGGEFTLTARRRCWEYGRTVDFKWGDEPVHSAAYKWIFEFSLTV